MEKIKPVRDEKLMVLEREKIRNGVVCRLCNKMASAPHHVFFGDDKDDRFIAPLSMICHGTDKMGAHGVNSREIRIILVRAWIKENPDRKAEILGYADARGYGYIREFIK